MDKFKLSDAFIEQYKGKKPPFGFNGLGELVYMRTYSRIKEDGSNEQWLETCQRVIDGTYNMQKKHIDEYGLGWNAWQAQRSAQEMYDRIFNMKFLPPGRGLWAMGTAITEERGLHMALNNCSFVSTENMKDDPSMPFVFLMDASMLGVGVGFDTKGAGSIIIKGPSIKRTVEMYIIPDTREGWVESVKILLESYFLGTSPISFDYSKIRKAGEPIKTFGGLSAGYQPLEELHNSIRKTLDREIGKQISITAIVDIQNHIGKAVVAGNVRRSAEIVFGDPTSVEYLNLKNYDINPQRNEFGWSSNNSVFANLGMNYRDICQRTKTNGEPGFAWLENMRGYSRMNNGPDNKDHRAMGANPCCEQTLESMEICNLVETFPNNHTDIEDYMRTLKFAYLYAKTVTLGKTHWPETNRVMLRNRRIGCSISGIQQFIAKKGLHTLKNWLERGYNEIQVWDIKYSDWLAIPRSIKTTSIKPSGSVSLLAGATPGVHWPQSRFYIRTIRLSKHSPLIQKLEKSGYTIEPCIGSEETTVVVDIPVDVGEGVRPVHEVSMWEQLSMVAFLQKHWSDNQVSATITFNPGLTFEEEIELENSYKSKDPITESRRIALETRKLKSEGNQIEPALNYFQYQLKGISFLPNLEEGAYPQMPYRKITEEEYKKAIAKLKKLNFSGIKGEEADVEKFCDGESCLISSK